jgi:hypothetical protein
VQVTRIREWDEEAAAGDLYVRLNGGTWIAVDGTTAPNSTYDLLATSPTGDTVAVEVTQHTTQEYRRQSAIENRLDWTSDLLDAWWEVSVIQSCDVRALHAQVFQLLADLYATGETKLVMSRRPDPEHDISNRLHQLGVRLAYRVQDAEPGHVNLSPASEAGSTAASVLVGIAEHHANLPDNALKLKLATAAERHLWIWVTTDRGQEMAALWGDDVPSTDPVLPAHVDAVWITTATAPATVWRWHRQAGWHRHLPSTNRTI